MPEPEKAHLVQRFVDAAEILIRLFFYERMETLGGEELTMRQVKTLAVLESRGPLSMTGLAFIMARTVSAMTSIVDRLVERGLIARQSDPHDRRLVICALTTAGELQITRFWRIDQERLQMLMDIMTDDQLLTAVIGLESLRDVQVEIQRTIAGLLADGPTPPEP